MRNIKRTGALGAAAALVLTLVTPLASASAASPLTWAPCKGEARSAGAGTGPGAGAERQCGTVSVPLDYRRPDGRRTELAVSRIPAEKPSARRGTLVLIPEGPGGAGLATPSVTQLPRQVREMYDIVGFDPRGLGASAPVDCRLAPGDLTLMALRPWPAADGGIADNITTGRRLARQCAEHGGPVLRSASTLNEARDIDRIRQALGERRISALGWSYGSYVGAVYAQLFPGRTDRWVLDTNNDPDPLRAERGWMASFATGAEDRFPDFARWASGPASGRPLAPGPAAVRAQFLRLAERLDRTPLPWPGAAHAVLNGNALRQMMLNSLIPSGPGPASESAFRGLAELMRAAQDTLDGRPAELPPPPGPMRLPTSPQEVAGAQAPTAVALATLCNDTAWPRDLPSYEREVAAERIRHPLTAGMPVNVTPCTFWPTGPAEPLPRITDDGPSNVLLIQNLRDPASPHSGALKARRAFGDRARMVTVDAGGHIAYHGTADSCGDTVVNRFLITGQRPARDTVCPAGAQQAG